MSGQRPATAAPRPGAALRRCGAGAVALLAVSVVVLALIGAGPPPRLATAAPADGVRLTAPPAMVSLRFTDSLDPARTHLTVVDATGAGVDTGDLTVSGQTVVRQVTITRGGVYRVGYHAGFDGGRELSGVTTFTVADRTGGPGRRPGQRPPTGDAGAAAAADRRGAAEAGATESDGAEAGGGHPHGRLDPFTGVVLVVDAVVLVVVAGVVMLRRRSRRP